MRLGAIWMRVTGEEQLPAGPEKRQFYIRWSGPLCGYSLEELSKAYDEELAKASAAAPGDRHDPRLSYVYADPSRSAAECQDIASMFTEIDHAS
ncbi:unnamed protein product, partial [marine sediment metagenome]